MPTVLRLGPYRFFFYSADGHEPRISMSSVTLTWPSFGWSLSFSKAAAVFHARK